MQIKKSSALSSYPDYQVVIGIEVHVQLKTESKMFCSCLNQFGSAPNKNICRVCSGQLGSLPTLNRRAVDYAIMAGLATNCSISKVCEFDRKHYIYPDLPKNYQITQDDQPICNDGYIDITDDSGQLKKVRILRIHIEEDAGKNLHKAASTESLLDLNRAGTPLIEIVSHPDIASAAEAVFYLESLRSIMKYIEVSDVNMEEGSFRADVNLSVKKKTDPKLGTRVELKNINSFKFISNAIEYEISRQIETIEDGGFVRQETRLWDEKNNKSVFMRSKEDAEDYRYFSDPDLPLIIIDDEWVERLQEKIPELPAQKQERFCKEFALAEKEAIILTSDKTLAVFFEETSDVCKLPKKVANWIIRDLLSYMNEHKVDLDDLKVTPAMLAELVLEVERGVVNSSVAQEVFVQMLKEGKYPSIIIQERGLEQIGSAEELTKVVQELIANFPQQSQDYRNGNSRVLPFFIGQAMKATKGKGNPKILTELFQELLK